MKFERLSFIILIFCVTISAQTKKQNANGNNFNGVTLSYLSQRCLPPDKVPYVGDDFIDFSDLVVRFRLENQGKDDIYYLADNIFNSISPVGFQLARKTKTDDWDAIYSPARGREGIFTGVAYHWLSLPPNSAIEFERSDITSKAGEHATSVFLNTKPEHKNRVEVVSNEFVPLECPKSKK